MTFRPGRDYLFPYYRDLATCVAAGLTAEEILLNGMSKAADVASGGRHMSNHFAKPSIGIQNVSSCVSNHSQHAAGLARAIKTYKKDAIVYCSIGESSTSEGYFYEAVNGASREKLPVVFVVQDNGYGISVPKSDQTANVYASDNFAGFKNLKIIHCDGLDVFDSFRAMREAVAFVRSGAGAAIVHATLRAHPFALQLGPPGSLPHAGGAGPGPRGRSSPPLPQAPPRDRVSSPKRICTRSRSATSARTKRPPTAPRRRPTRTRRRSTTSSSPRPGFRRPGPRAFPTVPARR